MLGLGVAAATMFWAHASSLGRKKVKFFQIAQIGGVDDKGITR